MNIDWKLLREQKHFLFELAGKGTAADADMLMGVVTLIDCIQDDAVDNKGISEDIVFGVFENNT